MRGNRDNPQKSRRQKRIPGVRRVFLLHGGGTASPVSSILLKRRLKLPFVQAQMHETSADAPGDYSKATKILNS